MCSRLPGLTIGILTHNRCTEVLKTLAHVTQLDYPELEILLIDNGSRDGTAGRVRGQFPRVRIIRLEKNVGASARNLLPRMASHDFVYSCDDDSYPKDSANLRAAMQYMLDNPRVCTLTTNVIDISTGISHCQGYAEFAWSGSAEQGYIGHFLLGGGTIMRRKCLTQVEGYPENFFWGREEADLSLQLLAQGCTLAYHPGFVTIHDRSGSGIKGSRWVYYYTRNPIWTAWRFFSPGTALRLSASWTLRCLFTHMPRGLAWTAGVFDALRGIPRLRNYREQLVRNAPAAGIELFCRHAYGDTISLRSVARRLFGANRLSPHKVWNRPAK